MDIKTFMQQKIAEREIERREDEKMWDARIDHYVAQLEDLEKRTDLPEKTDTLKKLEQANGKDVIVYPASKWYNARETKLDFSDGRVNTNGISYPLIGIKGNGIYKIVDANNDEVIFENPYLDESVPYQKAMLLGKEAGLEELRSEIDHAYEVKKWGRERLNGLRQAFAKVPSWIERGNKLIYKQLQNEWKESVAHRASDLYEGYELENALQIMEALEAGATVEDASKLIDDGHSGVSYDMMMSIVLNYSKRGVEFCKAADDDYKYALKNDAERAKQWEEEFSRIEKRNKGFETERTLG